MDEHTQSEHLSNSLTDLMTSLMVIFVLLLVAFITNTATKDATAADMLLKRLQTDLKIQGIDNNRLKRDPRDRNAILVVVPGNLMNFENQRADLKLEGRQWLDTNIPKFSSVLCDPEVASSVYSIVVEGHTDANGWAGRTPAESQDANLELSQKRSMAVVQEALRSLDRRPEDRACFLDRLSATGRGQQDPEPTAEASRRVIFRVRVKAVDEATFVRRGL
jgi:flagellar motor protein MotB